MTALKLKIPKFRLGEFVCFYCRLDKNDREDKLYLMRIVAMRYDDVGWKYDCEGQKYEIENMPETRLKKIIL